MKDLFKGHHPWLLVLVFTAALFLAGICRHSVILFGYSDFNANLSFIIVMLAIISTYALFFEYRRDGAFPKLIAAKNISLHNSQVEASTVAPVDSTIDESVISEKQHIWSIEDFNRVKEEITSDILMAINSRNTEIAEDASGVSTFHINLSKIQHGTSLAREEEFKRMFNIACDYTLSVLGPYLTKEGIELIFGRIMRFMQAVSATWEVRSAKELAENIEALKIVPIKPINRLDLLHYGWNLGAMFDKSGLQIGYFLKTTFGHHFDRLEIPSIAKKLTMKGECIIHRNPEFRKDFKNRKRQNMLSLAKAYEAEHTTQEEIERKEKRRQARLAKEEREAERERILLEKKKEEDKIKKMMERHPGLQLRSEDDPKDVELIDIPKVNYEEEFNDEDYDDYDHDDEDNEDDENYDDDDNFDKAVVEAMKKGKAPDFLDYTDWDDLSA